MQVKSLGFWSEGRGDGGVADHVGCPAGPTRTHALDHTQPTWRVVENLIITHDDAGMCGDRSVQGAQQNIPDLDLVIRHKLEPLTPI